MLTKEIWLFFFFPLTLFSETFNSRCALSLNTKVVSSAMAQYIAEMYELVLTSNVHFKVKAGNMWFRLTMICVLNMESEGEKNANSNPKTICRAPGAFKVLGQKNTFVFDSAQAELLEYFFSLSFHIIKKYWNKLEIKIKIFVENTDISVYGHVFFSCIEISFLKTTTNVTV